jgi:hypothetical protein
LSEISSLFPPSRFLFGCCPGLDVPARQQNPTSGMGNQTFGMHAWAWQKFETTEHQPNRMPAGSMSTLRLSAVDPCEVLPPVWDHLCLLALRRFLKLWSTTVRRIRYSPIPKAVNNRFLVLSPSKNPRNSLIPVLIQSPKRSSFHCIRLQPQRDMGRGLHYIT